MDNYELDGCTSGEAREVGGMQWEKGFEKCCGDWQGKEERQNLVRRNFYAFNLALIQMHESLYVVFLM